MAEKINFTMAAIDKLPLPAEGRESYTDEKTPGLILRVAATGCKSFHVFRRMGGRPTRLTIGRFPGVTVEQARRLAAKLAGEIAQGGNPAEDRRKARGEMTVGELFEQYLEKHAKPHKRSWREDARQWNVYVAHLAGRKVSAIKQSTVRDLHAKIGREHGPYQANRVLALVSTVFGFAGGEGFDGPNPCRGVRRFREQSRDRFLQAGELGRFFKALDAEPDLYRDLFRVLLLTGARIGNVASMAWADVDLDRGLWRVGAAESKSGTPLVVVLTGPVVEILRQRAEDNAQADEPSPWVFPGRAGAPVSYPQFVWRRIMKHAKIKDLRPHDLRRSMASWAVGAGASLYAIGKALGHRDAATTQVYARLDLTPIRQAVGLATSAILAAANGEPEPIKAVKALPSKEAENE